MSRPERKGPERKGPERLRSVRRSAFWWNISKWAVLLFSKVWFRIRCEGKDNLPKDGAVLLVANHASYLDPPMVGITASRWVGFLAQAGLASFGPSRWWLAQCGVTLIDRNAPSKAAMRLLTDCLKAGEVVGIFPEGTRSHDGTVGSFKSGVEFLVRRTRATVVPIGIDGSFRAFPRKAWFPRPRKIVVRYGEPWTAEQVMAEGGVEALRQRVAELARCQLESPGCQESPGHQEPTQSPAQGQNLAGNQKNVPIDAAEAANCAAREVDGAGGSSKGCEPESVDPSQSTPSSPAASPKSAGGSA